MDRKSLRAVGLTAYESSAYFALLELGPSSAREVSDKSKIPPTAAYPALNSLIKKGFAQEFLGEPKKFGAIDPKVALRANAEKRVDLERESADLALEGIGQFLASLGGKAGRDGLAPTELISLSTGYESSLEVTRQLFGRTKKALFIAGWGFGASRHKRDYETLHELSKMIKRGISVKFLVGNIEAGSEKKIADYAKIGIAMRKTELTNFSLVISDSSECKLTIGRKSHSERLNIHIKDRDLSKALAEYFSVLWKRSANF